MLSMRHQYTSFTPPHSEQHMCNTFKYWQRQTSIEQNVMNIVLPWHTHMTSMHYLVRQIYCLYIPIDIYLVLVLCECPSVAFFKTAPCIVLITADTFLECWAFFFRFHWTTSCLCPTKCTEVKKQKFNLPPNPSFPLQNIHSTPLREMSKVSKRNVLC